MERLYATVILFLCYFTGFGQVTFDQLPRDLQLYPRNAANEANIPVSGRVNGSGWTKLGVQLLREGKLSKVFSQTISPAATNVPFQFQVGIKAEPAEYSIQVFLYKNTDSTLIVSRNRIVSGDAYLIYGQSNALALAGLEDYYSFGFNDKYLRNCTFPYNSPDIAADMSWYPAKDPYSSVGGFGLTLQRYILQAYGIPTVVLNGAIGGTGIAALSERDASNPTNFATYYGKLLFRARWAGVDKQLKGIIWKQGEDEAGNGPAGYPEKFTKLYDQLRQDYGNTRIYVGQINILDGGQDGAAALRDFQRRTKYLYSNVETIATVGTPGYDGIHYSGLANQQLAAEQFRQIARDVYGSTDVNQINSPDIRKVFYNTRKDSITLVFDDEMKMSFQDTTFYSFATGQTLYKRFMRDYFYLDKQAGAVTNVSTNGNRVTLALKQPSTAQTLRYLPTYFSDSFSGFYDGPTLKNARGMRAFSFDSVPIATSVAAVATLAAKSVSERQIQVSWTIPTATTVQYLERAEGTPTNFKLFKTLDGTKNSYLDTLVSQTVTYYYRLRVESNVSESGYSNVASARPLVLAIEDVDPVVRVYPNPILANSMLQVDAEQHRLNAVVVRDLLGRAVKKWSGPSRSTVSISLESLDSGLYVVDLHTVDGRVLHRKLVIR
ncbi:sialate O-acetylesterase [Spirosoma rigui]|uniref:sialate O-acetylesterase n=1 Tax=Spirosoma rigui TaxID=564064 RepID=UPI0009B093FD|nr:sialate O-acetylesterase [Spirosoma rigui]